MVMVLMAYMIGHAKRFGMKKLEAVTKLGGYTEECLHSLRLIVSFAQEEHKIAVYKEKAEECRVISLQSGKFGAFMYGVIRGCIFAFFIYCYYMATLFVENEVNNPSSNAAYVIEEIVAVTQSLIISMFATLQLQTHLNNILQGKICAKKVFDII